MNGKKQKVETSLKNIKEKKKYTSPCINVIIVEMENGISAGSATISPTNISGQVQEDWTDGTPETKDTPW
ncbi:hypothetical protein M2T82_16280 [Elizabethkingia ursingii]|uniref:hypothetical protein n=1 Tax=Elizabethkingia ursingii TaxID=1756150 RepID=UPI002012D568|nr:hypothetical protein [Elizabethkingia ursingii]MCL1669623.1 hypothetical protein [Elizabethkingia ursingii]